MDHLLSFQFSWNTELICGVLSWNLLFCSIGLHFETWIYLFKYWLVGWLQRSCVDFLRCPSLIVFCLGASSWESLLRLFFYCLLVKHFLDWLLKTSERARWFALLPEELTGFQHVRAQQWRARRGAQTGWRKYARLSCAYSLKLSFHNS